MNRRLIVLDRLDTGWMSRAAASAESDRTEWDVLLLGLDEESFRRTYDERLASLPGRWRVIDARPYVDRAQRHVREFLVPFIDELPRRADRNGVLLGQYLEDGNENWWWFLEISEKSPFRGQLVTQLYGLALLSELLADRPYDELLFETDAWLSDVFSSASASFPPLAASANRQRQSPALWPVVRYWFQALRASAQVLAIWIVSRLDRWSTIEPEKGAALFLTFYPGWWLDPMSPRARDRFFPDLPDRHAGVAVGYAAWIALPLRRLWAERQAIANVVGIKRLIVLQRFIDMRSITAVLSMRAFLKLRRFRAACERDLTARFLRFDVKPLIIRELDRSMGTGELFLDRLLAGAVRELCNRYAPSALVFRVECQPFERAVVLGARGRTATAGFWHSPIVSGGNYLPFHFAEGQLARSARGSDSLDIPLPDAMLSTGSMGSQALVRLGYPSDRIAVCGPVRQRALVRYRARRDPRAVVRRRLQLASDDMLIFAAMSIVDTDSEALLSALSEVARQFPTGRLTIKLHPARRDRSWPLAQLLAAWSDDRVRICSDDDMHDTIAAADVVVMAGSTLAFEAIALGVMPIVFESPGGFSAFSLKGFSEAWVVVQSVPELVSAFGHVLSSSREVEAKQRSWPRLLRRVFNDLDRDPCETLFSSLDELDLGVPFDRQTLAALERPAVS